jgi:hypothetical protein
MLFGYTFYSFVNWFRMRPVRAAEEERRRQERKRRQEETVKAWAEQQRRQKEQREYAQRQWEEQQRQQQREQQYRRYQEQRDYERHTWERQQHQPQYNSQSQEQDPYVVLGVNENATEEEVENAWRTLISRYHTDKHQKDHRYKERTAKAAEINQARDEIKRRKGWK